MLKILAIGDVTTPRAAAALAAALWDIRKKHSADLVTVNAENAGFITGPTPDVARTLLHAGADVLTGGNHILQNPLLYPMLEQDSRVLRPVNYPAAAPGVGYTL
ncbi:MAG: YmdB family metallophosphoesterase, partial [Clostridia bacterium]|nr:YmdB family metallophosphoesterase [Clostridia bacterium]